ncbi:MAG: hypothetical protein L6Q37_04665 [Bdellovibrionaceae bacterium]|nr:hypothetical protein [Pseudobdellovibrionaceae bacterium]NUM59031.1 hypothetical protein [Pseudobdellovibrionaceae bacterium]
MGLAEKRAIESFKSGKFNEFQKQIEGIIGFAVEFDISWDNFGSQLEGRSNPSETMNDYMEGMFFAPMINAFRSICSDDMGKTALKSALKKIQMINTGNYYGDSGVVFETGVLKLDFYYANVQDVVIRETSIRTKIEAAL